MSKISIIAMDFDGTLLTSDKKVSDETKNCLIELKNKSYKIIGVTARNLMSVKNVLDVSLFDYIILNNGSDIYYVNEDKIVNVSCIDNDMVNKIYNLFEEKSYQIDFCTPHNYLIKTNKKSDARPFIKYIDGINDIDESVSRMNIFFNSDEEIEENRAFLNNTFDNINVVKMLDTDKVNSRIWLTINPKNVSKLITLKIICNDLNSPISEVIFFGDGENDLELIENVGIGVAMENAIEKVKEKASYVTASNDNDGIAKYLKSIYH